MRFFSALAVMVVTPLRALAAPLRTVKGDIGVLRSIFALCIVVMCAVGYNAAVSTHGDPWTAIRAFFSFVFDFGIDDGLFLQALMRVALLTFIAIVLSCAYCIDVCRRSGRHSYYADKASENAAIAIGITFVAVAFLCFIAGTIQYENSKDDNSQFCKTHYSAQIECPQCNTVNRIWQDNGRSWTELEGFECSNCKFKVSMDQCNGYQKALGIHKSKTQSQ